ncbi:HU family DNA-binding protein [Nodularia phage vB_NspS-kac65v162]|uniref:HU family DNA-binding protein n=3 Tax=Ravarandavirus kac65v151 TaxID=2845689 RepID=A0A482MIN9_9CAUD|nr:DNA binding protein [Nodularia phage vB_NspS-kac65v151]QBQ73218.1 HU family DNA-binding protein [Nodularia phage vB_NspS-kac65v151]QBQ73426.1 HU family DNA-binding protein [Nodularia phage vB_NspS-kac65v161]QBQ73632.1 HU family DNA-binding protein [Nodularia phage vB_NspS-kac65v162]
MVDFETVDINEMSGMNRQELVQAVVDAARQDGEVISQKAANSIIGYALGVIKDAVAAGDKVILVGFGSFEPRQRSARMGRNPQTNEAIEIPATTTVGFKAGKDFRDQVAGKGVVSEELVTADAQT